jgi:hypothetical protein
MTQKQLGVLSENTGLTLSEIISTAIDRMYQEETMNGKISVTVYNDDEGMFGGASSDEIEAVDVSASIRKFNQLVTKEIRRVWRRAEISFPYGPTTKTCEVYIDGMRDGEAEEEVQEIVGRIYSDGKFWVSK